MRNYPPPPSGFRMELKKVISENLFTNLLTVSFLARHFGTDEKTLCEWMKRMYGVTTSDWLVAMRMEQAEQMVRSGGYARLRDIAVKVGYYKYAQFSKNFKWHYGMTPGEYAEYIKQFPIPAAAGPTKDERPFCPNCGYPLPESWLLRLVTEALAFLGLQRLF